MVFVPKGRWRLAPDFNPGISSPSRVRQLRRVDSEQNEYSPSTFRASLGPSSGYRVFESAKPSDAAQDHKAVRISRALDQEQFRSLRKVDATRCLLALMDEFLKPVAGPLGDGSYEVI
jgi:hypothetical protein